MKRAARWEWALLIALLVSFAWGTWADRTQQRLSDKVLRLHVLANSDSGRDQQLKLLVKDALVEEYGLRHPGGLPGPGDGGAAALCRPAGDRGRRKSPDRRRGRKADGDGGAAAHGLPHPGV